jgi:polyisoprenoid-binding protein YceI
MLRLRVPLALLLALALAGAAGSALPRYVLEPGSRFWIEGTSTVSGFTCTASDVSGGGEVEAGHLSAEVRVPVRTFDCGVGAMNRDFQRALRAETHPEIRFVLRHAEASDPSAAGWSPVRVYGTLEMAGAQRAVTLEAQGRRLGGGRVQVRGSHVLHMTHFGVDPPSGMLGLVRAHDRVVVRFDLRAATR